MNTPASTINVSVEHLNVLITTQGNQKRSYSSLYKAFFPIVLERCNWFLKNETMAEDAAQEVFLKIFQNLKYFQQKAKLSTWIYSITRNYCMDVLEKQKRAKVLFAEQLPDDSVPIMEGGDSNEQDLQQLRYLRWALLNIPSEDKEVLELKYYEGLQVKEIANWMDSTESAIKMKIHRARKRVKAVLKTALIN